MTPKEISRKASAIFRATLPSSWAVRDQQDQEDYGVDYELEILTGQDTATGILFKAQQKGQLVLEDDGDSVKLRGFNVRKLRYLVRIRAPVALIGVDVTEGSVYWTLVQGNRSIIDAVSVADQTGQATVTATLPKRNLLSSDPSALLADVVRTMEFIVVESITELRSARVVQIASRQMDVSHVSRQLRTHSDLLRCEELELLLRAGKKQ